MRTDGAPENKERLLETKTAEHIQPGKTPGMCIQLGLLLHKNYLLKIRGWQATLTEIFVPVIFACLLLLIRSQIDVTHTPFDYNLNSSTPLLDPVALGYVFDGITCGAVDPNSGERFQSRAVFGVAGPNATVVDELDESIRLVFEKLANLTFAPKEVNCSNRPFLCNIPINKDAPQCKGPFEITTVVFKDVIESPLFVTKFGSRGGMESYMKEAGYAETPQKPPLLFGLAFTESGERGQWDYVIFGNRTIIPETYFGITNDYQTGFDQTSWRQYVYSGFIFFQSLVDSYIIASTGGLDFWEEFLKTVFSVQFVPFPIPAHDNDKIGMYLNNVIGLFFVLAFMWPFSRLVRNIVQEKEDRIKEGMRMMGMSNAAFWLSWSLMYAGLLTLSCVIMTLLLLPFFKYSNAGLIFLILFFFCTSLVSLACMISSLFNASKTAGTLSLAILFLLYIPYNGVVQSGVGPSGKLFGSLCSPTALSLIFDRVITFESAFVGLTTKNVGELNSNFAVSSGIFMLFLDTIIYAILAWYLDKVIKNQFGTSERWYFCCTPRYWCGGKGSRAAVHMTPGEMGPQTGEVQPVSEQLRSKMGVEVLGLTKTFGEHVAVNHLSLEMYEGQIFVLLGHNGAGKTTTINMLTGLLPITSGHAFIWGRDAAQDIDHIRSTLGVCPQHDILFPSLTVKEHLRLYGRLKGVPNSKIESVVDQAITEIQLNAAANQRAGSLSGGQKRRLSLAIALIGDSKVIFLDEPTSGVDPFSRRAIWDLLQKKKAGRVVILTTHFMDEADQLGDRICIMHHGKLRCCGTSLFLKNIFGVGYNIVMSRKQGQGTQELHEVLRRHVPTAEVLSDVGTELAYRLPLAASPQFPDLLRELETRGDELGCQSFGVSVTTLEEVFLRVAEEQTDLKDQRQAQQLAKKLSATHGDMKREDDSVLNALAGPSTSRHFRALLAKRWHNAKRDRKAQCCQFITPVCVLLFGLIMINSFPFPQQEPDLVLSFSHLNQPLVVPSNALWQGEIMNVSRLDGIPYTEVEAWQQDFNSLSEFSEELLNTRTGLQKQSRYGAVCLANFSYTTPDLLEEIMDVINGNGFGGLSAVLTFPYNVYVNMTARHGMPMYFNLVTNSILKQHDPHSLISMSVCRMPTTHDEQVIINSFIGLSTSISLALGMAFIPAAYVVFVVKERETNSKHLQLISGVDIRAYWLSNYVFDFASFLITGTLSIIIIQLFGAESYRGDNLPVIILAMLLFGLAVIPFSYLWSFLFRSASTAQNVMIMIYIGSGVLLLVMSFVFYSIESTAPYADTIRMFFRFFPNFCLGDTFFYLSLLNVITQFTFEGAPQPWDMQISGWDCVWLGSEAVVYFLLVLGLEYVEAIQQCLFSARPNPRLLSQGLEIVEDEDVEAEKKRIQDGDASGELIQLHGLRRVYPQKIAVNDLWFSIPKNQCFGFLGVNGAGKSTTLKMLTGDEVPTQGDGFLGGHSCRTEPIAVRRLMGYCPQFDALHPLMTGQETLEFYGRLRGVPEERLSAMVTYLAERLTLNQDKQHLRPAGTYSGGNKRKLSVGIALIGNPPVVFLDEPSTGMDPVSRRFMWDFISQTMLDRAVILTTHSMEECEALCSRIGILVHGRLKCIGSAQHLKTRFGTGFEFMLTCQDDSVEQVRSFVNEKFTGVTEIECYGGNIKYQLGKQALALSSIFDLLEGNRKTLGITEYSIGQSTLEQIFIRFAGDGDRELAAQEAAEGPEAPLKISAV